MQAKNTSNFYSQKYLNNVRLVKEQEENELQSIPIINPKSKELIGNKENVFERLISKKQDRVQEINNIPKSISNNNINVQSMMIS